MKKKKGILKLLVDNFQKYKYGNILIILALICGVYIYYFKYEKENKLDPASKDIEKTINELKLNRTHQKLVAIANINGSYVNMVKYKYRRNLLSNINAIGVIVIGAIGVSPIKILSIPLSIIEGISILYVEKTSTLYEECKEKYLLLQDILKVDINNSSEINSLKIDIVEKNGLCLY